MIRKIQKIEPHAATRKRLVGQIEATLEQVEVKLKKLEKLVMEVKNLG